METLGIGFWDGAVLIGIILLLIAAVGVWLENRREERERKATETEAEAYRRAWGEARGALGLNRFPEDMTSIEYEAATEQLRITSGLNSATITGVLLRGVFLEQSERLMTPAEIKAFMREQEKCERDGQV